jgi:hypothetical protein
MPATKEVPGVEDAESPQPVFFLRLRMIALGEHACCRLKEICLSCWCTGCIIFLNFLWIILFCIIIFLQWDLVDHVERMS